MKKIMIILLTLSVFSAYAVEDLRINGEKKIIWTDRSQPVFLTCRVASPDETIRVNVWEDADWNGRPNAGESLARSWTIRADMGPMDDGHVFPGNLHAGTVRAAKTNKSEDDKYYDVLMPFYPIDSPSQGYGSFSVEVRGPVGPGAPADNVQVIYSPPNPRIWGNAVDTLNDEPVAGVSVSATTTDSQTGNKVYFGSVTDSNGNFGFDGPPGDYKLTFYPFINSQVQQLTDYPITVPTSGTWNQQVNLKANPYFVQGKAHFPLGDSMEMTGFYRGTEQVNARSTCTFRLDGSYSLGLPAPGKWDISIGSSYFFPQSGVPKMSYFSIDINEDNNPLQLDIQALLNNSGAMGSIDVEFDGKAPAEDFIKFNINGMIDIHISGMDNETHQPVEFNGGNDTVEPLHGVFRKGLPKPAKTASSPWLDGNSYRIRVRAGDLKISAHPPFGFVAVENQSFTTVEGEIAEAPTLIWKFTSENVLTIEGVVRYPDGSPVEGAVVAARTLSYYSDRSRDRFATTDTEGKYKIPYLRKFQDFGESSLPSHTYHVGVYVPGGYTADSHQVLGQTSGVYTVNFDMTLPASVSENPHFPTEYALENNYPNPFNPQTTIPYSVADVGRVSLRIFDIQGRQIAILAEGKHLPGRYKATWDASGYPSGIYFIRMMAPGYQSTRKCTLLK